MGRNTWNRCKRLREELQQVAYFVICAKYAANAKQVSARIQQVARWVLSSRQWALADLAQAAEANPASNSSRNTRCLLAGSRPLEPFAASSHLVYTSGHLPQIAI